MVYEDADGIHLFGSSGGPNTTINMADPDMNHHIQEFLWSPFWGKVVPA
jgi:hypothetical protein